MKHNLFRLRSARLGATLITGVTLFISATVPASAVPGTFTEYAIPTAGSDPFNITAGPDGNLWFTEGDVAVSKIGRITTGGTITEFPIALNAGPNDIVTGPDGKMWFTEAQTGHVGGVKIGRINTDGTGYVQFPTKTKNNAGVRYITPAPGGAQELWFTMQLANKVGKITTAGVVTEYSLSVMGSTPQPAGIVAGPDGALWIAEAFGNDIARVNTSGVVTNRYPLPNAGSQPFAITVGPDNNLWFTETNGNRIGRITTAGVITEFTIPTASGSPRRITTGSDGNLWFTEFGGNKIGRITTAGVITEFTVPTAASNPFGITGGPDGNLWFVEYAGNKVGKVTPV